MSLDIYCPASLLRTAASRREAAQILGVSAELIWIVNLGIEDSGNFYNYTLAVRAPRVFDDIVSAFESIAKQRRRRVKAGPFNPQIYSVSILKKRSAFSGRIKNTWFLDP